MAGFKMMLWDWKTCRFSEICALNFSYTFNFGRNAQQATNCDDGRGIKNSSVLSVIGRFVRVP